MGHLFSYNLADLVAIQFRGCSRKNLQMEQVAFKRKERTARATVLYLPHILRLSIAAQDCSTPFIGSSRDRKDENWLITSLGKV